MTGGVACVIPAYRAAGTLAQVVRPLREVVPHVHVIVVDDGSSDGTGAVARAVADCTIRLTSNRGKGAALRAGFARALEGEYEVVLTLDADGQHDSACAPLLLAALDGHDVVIGQRVRDGSSMPWRRRMTNAMASMAIARLSGIRLIDTQCGFRAIRRHVLERVDARGDRYEFETDFLIRAGRAGSRICTVTVPTLYGAPSHFRAVRDSVRIVKTLWSHRTPNAMSG